VPRILGIDYGERRIGLAVSDPTALIAQPLPTLQRRRGKRPPLADILRIGSEYEVAAAVVGLPLNLEGEDTDWTREVRAFAETLARRAGLPVHLVDERLSSVAAERAVRSLGLRKRQREQKERVDSTAAMLILQAYLDRRSGDQIQ
jgi:putative holliday junction resolvase